MDESTQSLLEHPAVKRYLAAMNEFPHLFPKPISLRRLIQDWEEQSAILKSQPIPQPQHICIHPSAIVTYYASDETRYPSVDEKINQILKVNPDIDLLQYEVPLSIKILRVERSPNTKRKDPNIWDIET
jgi:hypothetical protein